MKLIRIIIVAAVLVVASGLHAAPAKPGPYAPIKVMLAYGDLGMISVNLTMSGNEAAKPQPTTLDNIKAKFPEAIRASARHPALQEAVKAYYSASLALFGGLDPQGDERVMVYQSRIGSLETALKQAEARVNTELAALGVSD